MTPVVFIASIFSSAFLLFLIQPLVTRMLLPTYGGSPAVWNTALVFFQTALLAGYLYAHLLSTRVSRHLRMPLHIGVLSLPLFLLPPSLPLFIDGAAGGWPAITMIGALAVMVGAPFFALSTNSSLIQQWWSTSGLEGSHDPYWLYGASNIGSLLALVAYPFVVEPLLGVQDQSAAWAIGYAVFVALTLVPMVRGSVARTSPGNADGAAAGYGRTTTDRVAPRRAVLWVARAAVGSSLLLSVTMQLTTDLAPVPLLWVVPLAIYLVTFVLAFSAGDRFPRGVVLAGTVISMSAALGVLLLPGRLSFSMLLVISVSTLFFGALLCHHDLASDRPASGHLTAFYLWISVGGAIGGILNSLVAPVLFKSVAELPITYIALMVLVYVEPRSGRLTPYRPSWRVGLAGAVAFLVPLVPALAGTSVPVGARTALALTMGGVWTIALARYVGLFGIAVGLASLLTLSGAASRTFTLEQDRSFFGVVQIQDRDGGIDMVHGNTVHGRQLSDPQNHLTPVSYYFPRGPLGSLVQEVQPQGRIGVIGLGTGSLAILAPAESQMVYYEIDPLVERLARRHFSFLREASAQVDVVIGDGRLMLAHEPPQTFDLLVIDAFSSDFVPVHLLTSEAVDLFLSKLTPNGTLAFHVSNRHLDLRRVLRGYADHRQTGVLFADYSPTLADAQTGAVRTMAAVLSPDSEVLNALASTDLWSRYAVDVPPVLWTDDRADLWSVLR